MHVGDWMKDGGRVGQAGVLTAVLAAWTAGCQAMDPAAALAPTPVRQPSTQAAGGGVIRFGAIADVQYADKPAGETRHYRQSVAKLQAAAADLNREPLSFVVHLGDLVDGGFGNYDAVDAAYSQIRAPRYYVLGNHEFAVEPAEQARVIQRLGLDKLGSGRGYYDFVAGDCRFIVLNAYDLSLLASPPGSRARKQAEEMVARLKTAKATNAATWNGGVGPEQLTWLRARLQQARTAGQRVIVLCHFPLHPADAPHNLWNDEEVRSIVEGSGVVAAWINGHNHAGGYGFHGGVHYLNLQGMVETADTTAYAVIEIHPDHIAVSGRGREPSRRLTLERRTAETTTGSRPAPATTTAAPATHPPFIERVTFGPVRAPDER